MKALPELFRMQDDGQRLVISWRWFKWSKALLYAVFLFQFGGQTYRCAGEELVHEPLALLDKPVPQIVVTLGLLGAVFFLAYSLLAQLLNSTRVEASDGELIIRHGPLPWPGNHTLAREELAQLYGEKLRHTSKNKVTYTWSLMAQTRSGKKRVLLKNLEEQEQVRYLERTLEQRLGIKDRPVGGEDGSGVVFDW